MFSFVFLGGAPRRIPLVLAALALFAAALRAAEPTAEDAALQAHLATGQFAPALAMARAADTQQQHDAWLNRIAAAQAGAGDRSMALRTASEIADDAARWTALQGLTSKGKGSAGGASEADFESLIDLIQSTIKPQSWDMVGGPGSIAPFPTGVYVDAQGVLRKGVDEDRAGRLAQLRTASRPKASQQNVRRASPLRMVSLPRLERHVRLLAALGLPPTEAMQVLAGLQRVQYVFVYPESGDVVLAGPAGDWKADAENRLLAADTGLPVVRLDDLVVVLRHVLHCADARFGCAITPTQEALRNAQAFLAESSQQPLRVGQRKEWLEQFRAAVGRQAVEVYGIDARTRAARILVEADYRMKLVGMGLEESVPGLESYLASIKVRPGQALPDMTVLRWWFAVNYDALVADRQRQAFAVQGQGVKVLSENELLTQEGQRVHTGAADDLNRQFARGFTQHFDVLCVKYPVYAELRNIFDLALVAALVREENLAGRVGWKAEFFGGDGGFAVSLGAAPCQVDSVVNCRVIDQRRIIAGVSGGVRVDPAGLVSPGSMATDRDGIVAQRRANSAPKQTPPGAWWWD